MADEHKEKSITLNKFKPNTYRLWVIQAKATLELNKCWGIVEGTEVTPVLPPLGAGPRAIAAAQNAINNWENRHILAREALLKSLDYAELGRVEDIQDSAPAIWN